MDTGERSHRREDRAEGEKEAKRKGETVAQSSYFPLFPKMATGGRSHRREDCDEEEDSRPQNHRQVAQGQEVASVVDITNLALHHQSLIQERLRLRLMWKKGVAQRQEVASVVGIANLQPSARGREVASVVGITKSALHPNLLPVAGFMTSSTVTSEMNVSSESSKLPVLFIERDHSSEERSLFDISTKKFHIIKNPDFQGAKCICGQGQWLLMCREVDWGDCWFSLFLLNPVSGVKIDLPTVHGVMRGGCTFSLSSGAPDLIISGTSPLRSGVFTLRIMRAGDAAWEEHSIGGIHDTVIQRVVLAGKRVLCVSRRGRVIVFDLLERSLRYFIELKPCLKGFPSVIECNGEIMMVDCTRPMYRYFRFTRFDWGLMNWVEVDERELRNASWFMDCPSACMRTCEGMKAYTLMPNEYGGPDQPDYNATMCFRSSVRSFGRQRMFNIYMHNLGPCPEDPLLATAFMEKKTTESLMPEDVRAMAARWVGGDILC